MITRRLAVLALAAALAPACVSEPQTPSSARVAPPAPPPTPMSPAPPLAPTHTVPPSVAGGPLRAVFHLSDPSRSAVARGLVNAQNALRALDKEPARFVLVVHGQAMQWLRRGEPENLGPQVAALLATGKVEVRVCQKTLEENHWQLADMVPGASVVPSGTVEVLRLQREGYAYFHP